MHHNNTSIINDDKAIVQFPKYLLSSRDLCEEYFFYFHLNIFYEINMYNFAVCFSLCVYYIMYVLRVRNKSHYY